MRRPAALAIAACACALAGCGGGDGGTAPSQGSGPVDLAPEDAALYAEAVIRPQGPDGEATHRALVRLTGTADPSGRIEQLLDSAAGSGFRFETDVKPWLGRHAGAFLTDFGDRPDWALLLQTTDPSSSRRALGHLGLTARVIDGYVVTGTSRGVDAASRAAAGRSLGESARYQQALGSLPEDRLATLYVGTAELSPSVRGGAPPPLERELGPALRKPVVAGLSVAEDALTLNALVSPVSPASRFSTSPTGLLPLMPAEAWGAAGIGGLGERIKNALAQVDSAGRAASRLQQRLGEQGLDLDRDLLSWLTDGAAFVEGTKPSAVQGALVLRSSDPDASRESIGRLPPLPPPLHLEQHDDLVILAYGDDAAKQAEAQDRTLESDPTFRRATDALKGYTPSSYFAVGPILGLAEASRATGDPGYRAAEPYLKRLAYATTASRRAGDRDLRRVVLGLKDSSP